MSMDEIKRLFEDSCREAPSLGFNRYTKGQDPVSRDMVLKSRVQEIEAFARDRGLDPVVVLGVAEYATRSGKVPNLGMYGLGGDDALATKHFIASEILNLAGMESIDWDGTKIPPLDEADQLRLFGKRKKIKEDKKNVPTVQGTLSKKTAKELGTKDSPATSLPVNDARAQARERGLLGTEDAALDAAALMGQTPGDSNKPENIWPKHSDALAAVLNQAGVNANQESTAPAPTLKKQRTRKEEERDILDFARYGPAFEKLRPQLDEMTTAAQVAPLYIGEPYMHRPPSIVDWDAAQRQEAEDDERGVKQGLSRFVVGKTGKPLAGGAREMHRAANQRHAQANPIVPHVPGPAPATKPKEPVEPPEPRVAALLAQQKRANSTDDDTKLGHKIATLGLKHGLDRTVAREGQRHLRALMKGTHDPQSPELIAMHRIFADHQDKLSKLIVDHPDTKAGDHLLNYFGSPVPKKKDSNEPQRATGTTVGAAGTAKEREAQRPKGQKESVFAATFTSFLEARMSAHQAEAAIGYDFVAAAERHGKLSDPELHAAHKAAQLKALNTPNSDPMQTHHYDDSAALHAEITRRTKPKGPTPVKGWPHSGLSDEELHAAQKAAHDRVMATSNQDPRRGEYTDHSSDLRQEANRRAKGGRRK